MSRPCKSAKTLTKCSQTKAEIEIRIEAEENLKGNSDNIIAPEYLNIRQKEVFKYIVNELKASKLLGNLDIYILSTCAIAIDRLQEIEELINKNSENMLNRNIMSAKEKYTKDFFKSMNELSLSPQSRAKIGNINLQSEKNDKDPVLKILNGGK